MRGLFIAIVAAQLVFLAGQAGYYQHAMASGDIVTLRVVPVDPRSLFLGNYMALSYDISDMSRFRLPPDSVKLGSLKNGDTVFVELKPQEGGARPSRVLKEIPAARRPGHVYLRATKTWDQRLDFGLERYYIPETRSEDVTRLWADSQRSGSRNAITVEASVDAKGHGYIRRVLVDGKPLEF